MTSFKNLPIKSKLTWVIMLTTCLALLLACAAFVTHHLFASREAMVLELSRLADVIGKTSASSLTVDVSSSAEKILSSLSQDKEIIAACLYKGGTNWAQYPKDRPDSAFPKNVRAEGHAFENDVLTLTRPVLDPEGDQLAVIFIQSRLGRMYARLRRDVGMLLVVLLA